MPAGGRGSPSPWTRGGRRGTSRLSSCTCPGETCADAEYRLRGAGAAGAGTPAPPRPSPQRPTWCTRPPCRGRGCRGSARHGYICRSGCSTCSTPAASAAAASPAGRRPSFAARPGCGQGRRCVSPWGPSPPPCEPHKTPRDVPGQGAAAAAGRVHPACGEQGGVTQARGPPALPPPTGLRDAAPPPRPAFGAGTADPQRTLPAPQDTVGPTPTPCRGAACTGTRSGSTALGCWPAASPQGTWSQESLGAGRLPATFLCLEQGPGIGDLSGVQERRLATNDFYVSKGLNKNILVSMGPQSLTSSLPGCGDPGLHRPSTSGP